MRRGRTISSPLCALEGVHGAILCSEFWEGRGGGYAEGEGSNGVNELMQLTTTLLRYYLNGVFLSSSRLPNVHAVLPIDKGRHM